MTSKSTVQSDDGKMPAGGAIFARLKKLGVDYVFCNSGTDFPPIIEGLAEAAAKDINLPHAIVIPHEHAAMGMAHGYYHATGRMQCVMLHTNVGLANGSIGAINAAHENIPVILMSGRTPVTEKNHFGSRTVPIGWGQEMKDQTALVREATKWDYELRFADQIGDVLDRAAAIARSTPTGPVYISLPRETLCEKIDAEPITKEPAMEPSLQDGRASDIAQLAQWICEAKNPLIISQRGTKTAEDFKRFAELANDWAIPVNHYWAVAASLPTNHPMEVGRDPSPWVEEADLIIAVDCLAPWNAQIHVPRDDARIVHIGPNPLFSRTPIRNFKSSLSITGETGPVIHQLLNALEPALEAHREKNTLRHAKISKRSAAIRKCVMEKADVGNKQPMSKLFVAKCLSQAIERQDKEASILSELGCPLDALTITSHLGYYQEPHSGGLGYSLPAALGMQLADRERLIFATMGDGSYMFANPTACHQIAEALELPIITIILNNEEWGAVRESVSGLYPNGYAAKANSMPLTALQPSPDFCKTAQASRAFTLLVERPEDLPTALDEAINVAVNEKRQVLLNVKIASS